MSDRLLLVGTRKGLWIGRQPVGSEAPWSWTGPHFLMQEVYACCIDTRGDAPRLLVNGHSPHWGPGVFTSDDLGHEWAETDGGAAVRFPADLGASVERAWQITPGIDDTTIWVGTQPSALFVSRDRGGSFELVRSLWDHPHREQWSAGFGGQAVHSILPHPTDPDRVMVAMSTGGVYQTTDGAQSWNPTNTGIRVYFLPDEWPEFGQCVHKIARHPARPDRVFAQNHHGVYRSDDGGTSWTSIADGLPSDFGMTMVVHPQQPDTIFVFPLVADGERIPPNGHAAVWHSTDAGESWVRSESGLPDDAWTNVMRDAMCTDDAPDGTAAGLYLGTRDGCVYASFDDGASFTELRRHLPDVYCVRAAVI